MCRGFDRPQILDGIWNIDGFQTAGWGPDINEGMGEVMMMLKWARVPKNDAKGDQNHVGGQNYTGGQMGFLVN